MIDLVQRALDFGPDDGPAQKCRKIAAGLERYGLAEVDALAL